MERYPVPDMAEVRLEAVLGAVADPVRLALVRRLADGLPHPKTPDTWGVRVQKSTLSHHFRALREAGLTRTVIDGRTHTIQLRRTELDARFPGLIDAIVRADRDPDEPAR